MNKMSIPNQSLLKFLATTLLLSLLASSSRATASCGIAVYWGRKSGEGSLREACASGLYSYINLAYLNISGHGSGRLDLDGHCLGPFITCPLIGLDVLYCQNLGIKVLLSLSGGVSDDTDPKSAKDLAADLWNKYLGGWSIVRPLGWMALDGIDFAVTRGPSEYYSELAAALKKYNTEEKKVYLSASPQCGCSDSNLVAAVSGGAFDYVWVQFYNNSTCDFSAGPDQFTAAWFAWEEQVPPATQLFIGLAASPSAAKTGYIPAEVVANDIAPLVNGGYPGAAGAMIWNRYYDKGYSKAVFGAICGNQNTAPGFLLMN